METLQFSRGDVIFMENSIGSSMYEIKSGSVGIYAAYGTDSERKLTELEAGRIFGEMGVIDVMPRSARQSRRATRRRKRSPRRTFRTILTKSPSAFWQSCAA